MKKKLIIINLFLIFILTSCAQKELKTPCPDYGAYCKKIPVNSWDYSQVS